jgi:hypothetical protein
MGTEASSSRIVVGWSGAGHSKTPLDGLRGRREHDVTVKARHRLIGAHHAGDLDGVRGRRHTFQVQLADPVDMVEHVGELRAHALDLLLGEAKAGETSHVENLGAVKHPARV